MDADSIRWGRRGEWWESASAVVRVEEKGERGGTEDPRGGGAEEMENFFAPPTSDGTGVTGGQEILPFSEEQNAEVFVAGGEGGGPTEGGVVFDESGGDGACVGFDGTGEMPFEEAVARRLVETLVGQPRERKEGERGGGEEPWPPTATQ